MTSRMDGPLESDWKRYRSLLPGWQEAYMERIEQGYAELLASAAPASEKFWVLEKRVREDKRKAGVVIEGNSRSRMLDNILALIRCGAIAADDLEGFSDELRRAITICLG